VFSNSLLTHLLETELGNYLRETFRLLQAGGTMMHSHFNMEHLPATYGKRHTFKHQLGNARIESEAQPEAAVAYHTDYLFRLCRQIGFSSCEIVHMPGGEQHQSGKTDQKPPSTQMIRHHCLSDHAETADSF
jgi:predicted SAM-dependent methyltransferase